MHCLNMPRKRVIREIERRVTKYRESRYKEKQIHCKIHDAQNPKKYLQKGKSISILQKVAELKHDTIHTSPKDLGIAFLFLGTQTL